MVLDVKNGFWYIQLDELSSFVIIFGIFWGCYWWFCLFFGVFLVLEEFQRRIDIVFEGLLGQKVIVDDILVFGVGDIEEEVFKDYD